MRSVQTISRKDLGNYLAGFADGEGSFNVSLRRKNDYRVGWQVVLSFNVSQKDKSVLLLLKEALGCGIIKTRKFDQLHSLDVTSPQDICRKVIPFFKEFSFLSKKSQRNFAIFSKIADKVGKGEHLNKMGLKEILLLRETLNEGKGRTRKYGIEDVIGSKESPETIRQSPA
jgi:hypothetical protein